MRGLSKAEVFALKALLLEEQLPPETRYVVLPRETYELTCAALTVLVDLIEDLPTPDTPPD